MKTREQFIDTVLERAEVARAAEKARRKRFRVITSTVAAAACLTLVIGVSGVMNDAVGSDGAAIEIASDLEAASQYGRATEGDQEMHDAAGNSGLDGAATEPNMGAAPDGSIGSVDDVKPGNTATDSDGLPADPGDTLKSAATSDGSDAEKVVGYFCIPAEIRIMDRDGNEIGCAQAAGETGKEPIVAVFDQVMQMEKDGTAVRLGQTEAGGKLDEATLRKAENWTDDAKYVQKVTYIYSYEDASRNPVWLLLEPIK